MIFARALILVIFGLLTAHAHVVDAVYVEFEETESEWLIGGVMDIAFVLPETRGVEDQGPLSRYDLMQGTAAEHARYADETRKFLRERVTISYAGEPIDYEIRILDEQRGGIYQLPEDPEDIAFLTTQLAVPKQSTAGELTIRWQDDLDADMNLSMERDGEWRYFAVENGSTFTILTTDGEAPTRADSLVSWLWSGFRHVIPLGPDHAAFMVALFCFVGGLRRALLLSLMFTIAHGITLALLVLGHVPFSTSWVELGIGVTIAWAGWEVWRQKKLSRVTVVVIFIFGLLHGLGFGSVLQDQVQGVSKGNLALPLVGFNVGVELAQISIIFLCALLLRLAGKAWMRWAGLAVLIYGLYLTVERAMG